LKRSHWVLCLAAVIAAGILSRVFQTGIVLVDKYLGDALYAVMVYIILRFFTKPLTAAVTAAVAMTAIELFQLTMIPLHMLASRHLVVRICARLMGTSFSFLDLRAYAVGILCIYIADRLMTIEHKMPVL
jgi:hypothetical protein